MIQPVSRTVRRRPVSRRRQAGFATDHTTSSAAHVKSPDLFRYLDENVVGKELTFAGPYGRRAVVYCDYTASARALKFIEEYITNEVLPYYGNTHTTTTITSMQSTLFRQEARDIIRSAVHASENDLVVFAGHGCTGAVHKLIHNLAITPESLPVVFVGPSEHHSNLIPWRELGSKIVRISETKEGMLDLVDLEKQLEKYRQCGPLIGCFSAASNITGILADDVATTLLLHQYGALAFWDYATAAPYVELDMNPLIPGIHGKAAYKDAIFFSCHKFVGGVQTPGILVAKKSLFVNPVPQACGGGTVFFVSRSDHRYLKDVEMREEGGTAAIVESIRAGLVFQLKQSITPAVIMAREEEIIKMVLSHIRTIPEIMLLGSTSQSVKRLAIFSFMVRHPRGTFLHHNFLCAVLNDMFGIQARGGCACAGPYAQDLMGIDEELAKRFENVLLEDSRLDRHHLRRHEEHSNYEMLRPGFTRISLPYFMPDTEVAFVLEALKMVATEGWKLLPQYILNPETGEWRHHTNLVFRERKWLGAIHYSDGKMSVNERRTSSVSPCPKNYADCLSIARNTFNHARKMAQRYPLADQCVMFEGELNDLRWFMLPSEAQDLLLGHSHNVKQDVPFQPPSYSNGMRLITPQVLRHNSLTLLDTKLQPVKSELKLPRQRSDSQSPTRNRYSPLPPPIHLRERCYSVGSELVTKSSLPSPTADFIKRHRQVSCGSQTDVADSDASLGDIEFRTNSPMLVTTNSPEHLHAYMQGVTKELATEIKSELREVIAKVEDVLSETSEVEHSNTLPKNNDKGRIDLSLKVEKPPVQIFRNNIALNKMEETNMLSPNTLYSSSQTGNDVSPPSTQVDAISADKFSEYLAELTTEMVSEMKSEFREMVCAVDELISPNNESQKLIIENSGRNRCTAKMHAGIPCIIKKQDKVSQECEADENKNNTSNLKETVDSKVCSRKGNCGVKGTNENQVSKKHSSSKPCWHCPPKNIWKPTYEAINEFDMVRDGDRILVCLSGGKDSLSLLHTLHQYQHYAAAKGVNFDLGAATVDPGSSSYDPSPLKPYLSVLGVQYFYEEQSILAQASTTNCKSICSFCSRMKRGRLYATARQNNFNVLALGQHLDDLAESFLMSTFHNGRLRSMKANYYVRERDLRVIRPFVYVRERFLRQFAESRHLPIIPENCPACFHAPKERHRMKQLLAQQEILFPRLFLSLRTAIKPLISVQYTGQENNRTLAESLVSPSDIQSNEDSDF